MSYFCAPGPIKGTAVRRPTAAAEEGAERAGRKGRWARKRMELKAMGRRLQQRPGRGSAAARHQRMEKVKMDRIGRTEEGLHTKLEAMFECRLDALLRKERDAEEAERRRREKDLKVMNADLEEAAARIMRLKSSLCRLRRMAEGQQKDEGRSTEKQKDGGGAGFFQAGPLDMYDAKEDDKGGRQTADDNAEQNSWAGDGGVSARELTPLRKEKQCGRQQRRAKDRKGDSWISWMEGSGLDRMDAG